MNYNIARIIVISLCIAVAACGPKYVQYKLSGSTMGTVWNVVIEGDEGVDIATVTESIETRLEEINDVFSTWQADSEISRINVTEGSEVALSTEFAHLLQTALYWHAKTDGAFDITVKPLVDAYGFSEEGRQHVPSAEELSTLLTRTGSDNLYWNAEKRRLIRMVKGINMDFSAIAKGYAVKEISQQLTALGLDRYLVEIGGEVQVGAPKAGGKAWIVAVEEPSEDAVRTIQRPLQLINVAIATSGDYRNYREIDGLRINHIVNPKNGRPVQHNLASVSVIHKDCAIADILATALVVMGEEAGMQYANELEVPVYMIVRQGNTFISRHNALMEPYFLEQ